MKHRRLMDIDVKEKKVLVRVDFNVPMDGGTVTDDTRIRVALPTIEYLLKEGAAVILLSHLGRPRGQVVEELRLDPVAQRLSDLLEMEIKKTDSVRGPEVQEAVDELVYGEVLLLENTRFEKGETENDSELAREWASLGDVFVNDAFGSAHRAHCSNVGLGEKLPAVAGFLLEEELSALGSLARGEVEHPYMAIMGGAKVSDKIGVIEALLEKVDTLLLAGGMANTFLKAKGWEMGDSLLEKDHVSSAQEIMKRAEEMGKEIILPSDLLIAREISEESEKEVIADELIPAGWRGVDIGPATIARFKEELDKAKTVFWNGPLGVFEVDAFARGTMEVAQHMAEIQAWTVIGGGDSVAAVEKAGVAAKIRHISTGGGAALEFLEKGTLPGLEILREE